MTRALPAVDVVRRRERIDPIDDRKLRAALADGSWTRITTGVFMTTVQWKALSRLDQHRVRTREVMRRRPAATVVSHFAAAALNDIDVLGNWPVTIDVTCAPARGGRSSGAIRRHPRPLDGVEVCDIDGLTVTTPAQTALDLARLVPHVNAVAIIDQAIRAGRPDGRLTSVEEILRLMGSAPHRGDARAIRALSFADAGAANVRESQSRVEIVRMGFPKPRTQERRVLPSGRVVFGDFYWPEHDHWGELDGNGKYLSPEFDADRQPGEIVIDEKNRENEIRRGVRGFSRWEPADIDDRRRLYDILTSDGLPSTLPRP